MENKLRIKYKIRINRLRINRTQPVLLIIKNYNNTIMPVTNVFYLEVLSCLCCKINKASWSFNTINAFVNQLYRHSSEESKDRSMSFNYDENLSVSKRNLFWDPFRRSIFVFEWSHDYFLKECPSVPSGRSILNF